MKYAVAFTTYAWDDFVERQYQRVTKRVGRGEVWVVADESRGSLGPIPAERVIRTRQSEILGQGGVGPFVECYPVQRKSMLWWNLDYLTYRFFADNRDYDYCLTMDYDACLNFDVDAVLDQVAARGLDFVAHSHIRATDDWMWTAPHRQTYPSVEIEGRLLAITIISRAAADFLMWRRCEMAIAYAAGTVPFWPFCEVFMPVELRLGGFRMAELSEFGDTGHYGWRPAHREAALAEDAMPGFIHPVLDNERYLRSTMAEHYPFTDILRPGSDMRRELQPYSTSTYLPYAVKEVRNRLSHRLGRLSGRS